MTKIADLLAARRTLSFEFPTPRTEDALRQLEKTVHELSPLQPSFCSVTYGAGGSSRDGTHEAVLHMHNQGIVAMPHLTCVGHTRGEVIDIVEQYKAEGIENLLAIAGDPPLDGSPAGGDFTFAIELVELVRELGDFSIGVSAFPEVHPRSTDRAADRQKLADKLRLADFAITQFFWTSDHYFRLRDELDALGVTTPIIPSVFPIEIVEVARRFSRMNGTEIPAWLDERMNAVEGDRKATRALGVEVGSTLAAELLAQDVPGLHLYTMNRARSALRIARNVGL